jgi:hypothetical protein
MKLQVIAYNGRVEFQPVRKPAVSASTQAGRTSRLFKGIGNGHRKGIGSIVNVVDSSAWKISWRCQLSVASADESRFETLSGGGSDSPPLQLQGKTSILDYSGYTLGFAF